MGQVWFGLALGAVLGGLRGKGADVVRARRGTVLGGLRGTGADVVRARRATVLGALGGAGQMWCGLAEPRRSARCAEWGRCGS
ncbi:hypothetical protein, partial [Amycolatopsis pretoriensis]|uniref:hypothetical protein n=1 Tax=Amycolatopsis pretoriensis TaxID=218821 RepID=UPI001B80A902